MDLVHGAVDRARPVHHGLATIAVCPSSSVLGKGSTRVSVLGSPGLGRRRSGGASAVKAAAGRALVWVARGSKIGQGGPGEEGILGHPFIRSEGDWGGWASEGNMRWRWCTIMLVEVVISGGDHPGWWWGVMRGGGGPAVLRAEGASGGGPCAQARRR
jgi:hypothetical protein